MIDHEMVLSLNSIDLSHSREIHARYGNLLHEFSNVGGDIKARRFGDDTRISPMAMQQHV